MAQRDDVRLIHGDCEKILPTIPDASVDCVITDPPYPCIKRSYGVWTEAEWFDLMRVVVPECMRILKPTGSAVFILQPNSERVGRMRTWLWEFMAWVGKEWGIVQDAWWWNYGALPTEMANHQGGMRASLKACVWVGATDCYRNQPAVMMQVSEITRKHKQIDRHELTKRIGTDKSRNQATLLRAWKKNGGVTPFNVLVCSNCGTKNPNLGHGAATPMELVNWWLRYICPPGGTVLDPFSGSGTVSLAALKQGKRAIGIERIEEYHRIAEKRIADEQAKCPLFAGEEVPHGTA